MSNASEPFTLDGVIAGVTVAYADKMPDDLFAEVTAFRAHHKPEVYELLAQVIAVVSVWLSQASKHTREIVAEQVGLQQAHLALALIAKGMKARRGEANVPGRFALAAFHFATIANGIESGSLDLDGADKLLAEVTTPIERERDRLRELIEEIADMDVGDIEMEHQVGSDPARRAAVADQAKTIVARCRAEMKRWEDE